MSEHSGIRGIGEVLANKGNEWMTCKQISEELHSLPDTTNNSLRRMHKNKLLDRNKEGNVSEVNRRVCWRYKLNAKGLYFFGGDIK